MKLNLRVQNKSSCRNSILDNKGLLTVLRFSLCLFLVSPSSAFAIVKNPLIRVCQFTGGIFFNLKVTQPKADEIAFCEFGEAAIGSQTLMETVWFNKDNVAVRTYKKNDFMKPCAAEGAIEYVGTRDGRAIKFCQFADGSLMESTTYLRGPKHPHNFDLNLALDYH